jgi:hypothetical protein
MKVNILLCVIANILVVGPAFAGDPIIPDNRLTPGPTDPKVNNSNICAHNWGRGAPPVAGNGNYTYSKAARETPQSVKEEAFARYGITDPHDGGQSYEVDHRVPLSLGGLDVVDNLWPETRTATKWNAYVKDRLELRIWKMVCEPEEGQNPLSLKEAQDVFKGSWIEKYPTYCKTTDACPPYHPRD